MASSLEEIKVNVANFKRKITNFVTFINSFDSNRDLPILEKRKLDVDNHFSEFEKWQTLLELSVEDDNHPAIRTEYEERYYSACSKALNYLKTTSTSHDDFHNSSTSSQSIERINNLSTNHFSKTNLPRLNLPTFDGSYETWIGFHDLFKSLVDEDKNISGIEKLYYLKGCLTGDAAQILASIELSAQNYNVAWELLKERYDNRKIIRQTHVKAILNLPHLSKEFSVRALLDRIQKHIRALEALKEPINTWDTLLVEIVKQKLNSTICEKWEESSCESVNPTFKELTSFLQRRAQFEDTAQQLTVNKPQNNAEKKFSNPRANQRSQQSFATTTSKYSCAHCQGEHSIYSCDKFKGLSPEERFEAAKKTKLCINCLRSNHRVADCTGSSCRKCNKKHHTLLHFEKQGQETIVAAPAMADESPLNRQTNMSSEGLLATALVDIVNSRGESKMCRAFLDSGSQANFITENIASHLNLPRKRVNISVSGVDSISTEIKTSVSATVKSRFSKYSKNLEFLVLDKITKVMPSISINHEKFEIPKNIMLADPEFHKPAEIDVLIGVKLFFKLLSIGQISLKNYPEAVLQKTQLGWIVTGEINEVLPKMEIQCHLTIHSNPLDVNLTKFWEVEEFPSSKILSKEEEACENHFREHTRRNPENGQYVVRLPFNEKKDQLGSSRSIALRRFHFLEKRFEKDPKLKANYCEFIDEYTNLKHLCLTQTKNDLDPGLYLPHHAIMKEDSLTTKTRVVFDGSAKTSSGISLNETLMVGPSLQNDLFSILTRFRSHPFAFTADIEKMYRQILVHPDDTHYQKIFFRKNADEKIQDFTLNTVTYGTSCAPFLAIRVLHQLADDEKAQHPIASTVLKSDFFVDDCLSGGKSRSEALELRDDLIALLKKGGFHLRKWASNDPTLIPENLNVNSNHHMSLDPNSTVKTLGIHWDSQKDTIFYKIDTSNLSKRITKRSILSSIAKLFDPLGLLAPVIVKGKIILQLLWKAGISWDSSVPAHIHTMWLLFKDQLPLLEKISFNRLILDPNVVENQIHGFCDASEQAYGACIYLRSTDMTGKHRISLICSKSRVAPVKPLTLPRLELCAALLLCRLYKVTQEALQIQIDKVYLWSDSTITLHWLNTEPHLLKTFVSNRVVEIQETSKNCQWRYTPTLDNPADPVSRGQTPQELLESQIWKNGPPWLNQDKKFWPQKIVDVSETLEKRKIVASPVCIESKIFDEQFLSKFSSINKLKRIIAFVLRFINNIRIKAEKIQGSITAAELETANLVIIRITQFSSFSKEITCLKIGENISEKSKIIPLMPFLDEQNILRVGGRLQNANLPLDKKHQILLPSNHYITRLIIRDEHERLKHAGTQATLYSVRELYWPINGKNTTRQIIHKCVRCFRAKPRSVDYVMGSLPKERVSHNRPFLNVGVDYCGPLYIKEKRFRNRNKIKTYVALFICLCTKAVHLELVSDLTTEAFLAALKRLFSRRGISKTIRSDNGTNFVGASRELLELHELFQSTEHNETVRNFLANQKIEWTFNPPRSPHFGGLWEAAVKSCKHHLTRTVGDTLLTYEQLETYLIEIEAILNSRPLTPISSDPTDLQPLTPGHFLIGGPLTSFPQLDFTDTPSNRLSAWQHGQKLRHHFWKRWHREYLHQLTVRSKWHTFNGYSLKVGTMVAINDENLPPLQWKIGRIIQVHPGSDGIVRVATVKTSTGEYKRCVKRLCPLPIEDNSESAKYTQKSE